MNENDHKRLLNFYEDAYLLYGDGSRSVHWSNEQTQNIRFEVLSAIGDLHKKKVLDVGSGLGDMYTYFLKKGIEVDYTGIDIVPIFIERSRVRFPEGTFMHGGANELTGWYDYILVSGSFNFTIENAQSYYFNLS